MIIRRLVLAVLLLAAPAANAADEGPYLFDMLEAAGLPLRVEGDARGRVTSLPG